MTKKIERKTKMFLKGISRDDIPENRVGRWANRSFRMRTMTISESSPTNSPRRVVPYFLPNISVVYFLEQIGFCFENDYFLIQGLGECERVGEDSGSELVK